MAASASRPLRHVSTCTVKPPPHPRTRCHLAHWDLAMLSVLYIQKGLLFSNLLMPSHTTATDAVAHLKSSLSAALGHFYPLAGRLVSEEEKDEQGNVTGIYVSIDCDGQGAELTHAVADGVSVDDVLSPSTDVPAFVNSFFPLTGAVNYDGHHKPLLAVQVTELLDGFFVACCFNHAIGDGTSYWMFFNAWAEIARSQGETAEISRAPVLDRWFDDHSSVSPPIKLPFAHPDEFVLRVTPPVYRERIFHLSADAIARLKARTNEECGGSVCISSLQSVAALMWRCITRARGQSAEQTTICRLAAQNRSRLEKLSPDYFGNSIYPLPTQTTAGELLANGIGWAARRLHETVAAHTDGAIRKAVANWMAARIVYNLGLFEPSCTMMGSSPRFDVYGCDFGWGKAVAARSGVAHKFDGKVTLYPGREGGGSMDLEVCMEPPFMAALENDDEFMSVVSPPAGLRDLLETATGGAPRPA